MHWLPLVAMVIASALPFPHNPVSRIAAATTEPGVQSHGEQAASLPLPPVNYNKPQNASQLDYYVAAGLSGHSDRQELQDQMDYPQSSRHEVTSGPGTYQWSQTSSSKDGGIAANVPARRGTPRTEGVPKDVPSTSSRFVGVSQEDAVRDLTERRRLVNAPAAHLNGQTGPRTTVPSEEPRGGTTAGTGQGWTSEDGGLNLDAGAGLDGIVEGDEMFLDAHPRVLFSPSPSPPPHPPLLLMLETGLLEEGEEQEDSDGYYEGHGDREIGTGGGTLSWTESLRPIRRDKRSHLMDRRRGEKSVCESESVWVTDKTSAIDSHNQRVTILQKIQTQTGPLQQYFYETRCRQPEQRTNASHPRAPGGVARPMGTGVAGAGCLGVDKKQWVSECKAKQSFVRALTKDANNRVGWRWIRIDSSCVCVLLSRTNQALGREVLARRGRG